MSYPYASHRSLNNSAFLAVLSVWDLAIDLTERLIDAKRQYKTGIVGRALIDIGAKRGFIRDLAAVNPREPKGGSQHEGFVCRHGRCVGVWALTRKADRVRGELGNGYTQFINGDVLVAKITPCFENGKGALAHSLTNGVGFGTTEFHVVRSHDPADVEYLHQVTLTRSFRIAVSGILQEMPVSGVCPLSLSRIFRY